MSPRDDVGQELLGLIGLRWRGDGILETEFEVTDCVGVARGIAHANFRIEATERLQQFDESQIVLGAYRVTVGAAYDRNLRTESVLDELVVSL